MSHGILVHGPEGPNIRFSGLCRKRRDAPRFDERTARRRNRSRGSSRPTPDDTTLKGYNVSRTIYRLRELCETYRRKEVTPARARAEFPN